MDLASTNSPPTATAHAPALRKSPQVSRLTPPVGIISICGNGAFKALIYFAPPTFPQGNTFTTSAPASHAVRTSVGVSAPGQITFEYRFAISTVASFNEGVTKNSAPASMQ